MIRGRSGGAWMIAVALVAAGCSSSRDAATSASNPTSAATAPTVAVVSTDVSTSADADPNSVVPATPNATTPNPTITDSSTAVSTTTVIVADTSTTDATNDVGDGPVGACAFTPAVASGEITWVRDGQLRALTDGARPTCLIDGVTGTAAISWTSDAGRALLDPTTSVNASGRHATGFDPTVTTAALSAPSGSATIAIDPAHHLIRHGADGAVTDISFLVSTDAAIYHPSGKRIIAVGTSDTGAYGIWLSSNLGADPKQILSVEDPSTPVTNLTLSADGQTLYFVHGFVHRLYVPQLQLEEVGVADRNEDHLVVSKLDIAAAWTIGTCTSTGSVLLTAPGTDSPVDVRTIAGSPFADGKQTLAPVGWLSDARLVIAARAGCEGRADVWTWSAADGFHLVASQVLAPAVRVPRGPFTDLPDTIEQAAPG